MSRSAPRLVLVWLLASGLALGAAGCAFGNKLQTTQVTVQVRSDRLLHIAAVPRQLPNGERPIKQLRELLDEVAKRAGGYTVIENAVGGWVPPGKAEAVQELNDLLLVEGPPELKPFLQEKLREDFQQQYPFVISLPVQSIAIVRELAPAPSQPAEEKAPESVPAKE